MSRSRSDHFTAVQFLIYDVIMAGLIRFLYMLQKSSWSDRVGLTDYLERNTRALIFGKPESKQN